ncbi:CMP-N-acetylneuraminate-beta-galactosamide-alpha-2,3-sialyltransferase 1 isoform X2 [Syngnathus scovelli]|uniref:CMP-N-acetylneuraminate-beta-galactosamide- alpha-2,3-sialyltransferase 1 isoform X2 n=1 Tax=Syngnathus scovelli TaxID=161590 RepID=UPI002110B858|nr:CMP-N-acetylneuraminate-beta-galactosamide-alpha-2,3-sialyltransferase 1 isoform X2 [Syngnathus scovelli]
MASCCSIRPVACLKPHEMLSRLRPTWLLFILLCFTAANLYYKFKWNTPNLYWLWPQSVCSCQKCLAEGAHEFKSLIDASPKPFLSIPSPTTEDDFNWWKKLQIEQRSFAFLNETINNLFTIFPHVPQIEQPSPDRCRTCAVVGNSGNLRGSHYGPLIDHHNMVIRLNRGPTKGYESDVGSKTTHRVMYPESASSLDNSTHLVFFPFKINDLLWLLRSFAPRENGQENPKRIGNKNLVMIVNPAFLKYVHEIWLKKKGRYPSTGFMTLVLSLQLCDEVSVFGFGADRDGNWNHYFEILRNKKLRTGPHPGMQEYEVIRELHQRQIIRFFQGL